MNVSYIKCIRRSKIMCYGLSESRRAPPWQRPVELVLLSPVRRSQAPPGVEFLQFHQAWRPTRSGQQHPLKDTLKSLRFLLMLFRWGKLESCCFPVLGWCWSGNVCLIHVDMTIKWKLCYIYTNSAIVRLLYPVLS